MNELRTKGGLLYRCCRCDIDDPDSKNVIIFEVVELRGQVSHFPLCHLHYEDEIVKVKNNEVLARTGGYFIFFSERFLEDQEVEALKILHE